MWARRSPGFRQRQVAFFSVTVSNERLGLGGLPTGRLLPALQALLLRGMFLRQLLCLLLVPLFYLLLPRFINPPSRQPLVVLLVLLLELLSLPVLTRS